MLTTVDQAVYRARRAPSGPVHLNLMFREPFLPEPDEDGEPLEAPERWRTSGAPYTRYAATKPAVDESEVAAIWEALRPVERGVVVAGRLASREQGEAVARLAGLLAGRCCRTLARRYGSARLRQTPPSTTMRFWQASLSGQSSRAGGRSSRRWTCALQASGTVPGRRPARSLRRRSREPVPPRPQTPRDAQHRERHSLDFCAGLSRAASERPPARNGNWLASWTDASEEAGNTLDVLFSRDRELNEPLVARLLSRHVPEEHGIVLASSMPVRDMDTFATPDGATVPVAANRGASGIDGTVATAAGFARGSGRPVTLLIGDLALLHDLNSLAILRNLRVIVVVLNNDGGGIFSFLPVSQQKDFFEPYFGTPQGAGFENAAAMFGLGYECPRTVEGFSEVYRAACDRNASTLIEIKTNREDNVALHREILGELSG